MRAALFSLLAFLPALPLSGQDVVTLCPSRVVRWDVGDRHAQGKLVLDSASADSFKVTSLGRSATNVYTIARSAPGLACRIREDRSGKDVLKGLLVGGMVGGMFLLMGMSMYDEAMPVGGALKLVGVFGMVGVAIGGATAQREAWQPITPPLAKTPQQVSLLFDGRRVGVRVKF